MSAFLRQSRIAIAVAALAAFGGTAFASEVHVKLSGAQEVPAVTTTASGSGTFKVEDDMSISGDVKTTGVKGIAAHIHEGAPGVNGGVAVPLTMKGENEWTVPPGTKLTAAQMQALKAGNLYVNVHSDAHKDGEIRGQLKK
jgi:hypothetical protein